MTWSFFVVYHWLCKHCADLKTIKPINKTHIFFVSESVLLKPKLNFKSLFYFVLFLVSILFLKPWLVFYDWVNMTPFSEFISSSTHSSHTHTKNALCSTEFSFSKKQKERTFVSAGTKNKQHKIFLLLEQSNSHKHTQTIILLFVLFFLFVWFDKCWIEWQVFCFFVFWNSKAIWPTNVWC